MAVLLTATYYLYHLAFIISIIFFILGFFAMINRKIGLSGLFFIFSFFLILLGVSFQKTDVFVIDETTGNFTKITLTLEFPAEIFGIFELIAYVSLPLGLFLLILYLFLELSKRS